MQVDINFDNNEFSNFKNKICTERDIAANGLPVRKDT